MLSAIDAALNRFTMYRTLLYGLILLLAVALVFSLTGNISINPGELLIGLGILIVVSYAANYLMAKSLKVATNSESWLISALILACILPPPGNLSRAVAFGVAAILAIISKFLLTWRRTPLLNPAAVAALVMSLTGWLPATWWIASPPMAAFTAIIGGLILRKQRKFSLFASFAVSGLLIFLFVNHLTGNQSAAVAAKTLLLSWPLLFMGSIMLTEPSTLPATRYYQVLYGVLVGCLFTSQLHAGGVASTPQVALIVGNLFALCVTSRFAGALVLKRQTQLNDNTYELVFESVGDKRFNFLPGQYMEWTLPHAKVDNRGNRRTFSLAASPTEKELRIGFRHYEPSSSFKTALLTLRPGQTIRAARPAGDFLLPTDPHRPLVFIAGGIGITPFRSIVKYLTDNGQKRQISLFYIARSQKDFVYRPIFDAASAVGLKTFYVEGEAQPEILAAAVNSAEPPLVYISGPNAMVKHYQKQLLDIGLSRRQIRTDYFSGY